MNQSHRMGHASNAQNKYLYNNSISGGSINSSHPAIQDDRKIVQLTHSAAMLATQKWNKANRKKREKWSQNNLLCLTRVLAVVIVAAWLLSILFHSLPTFDDVAVAWWLLSLYECELLPVLLFCLFPASPALVARLPMLTRIKIGKLKPNSERERGWGRETGPLPGERFYKERRVFLPVQWNAHRILKP